MKKGNSYAHEIPHLDDIPKTVLGAIAISLAVQITGNEDWHKAITIMINEWYLLNRNEIVPQIVPANLKSWIDLHILD